MDLIVTPQPHLIPGYTGHCAQHRFRTSKTYGKLTHKLLIDPCVNHAPQLIVTPINKKIKISEYPTAEEKQLLNEREKYIDTVYHNSMIPGYDGFIPNLSSKTGLRYMAAATAGVAEHEQLLNQLRCNRRFLQHRDLLESGEGLFEHKLGERLMPMTTFRAPLIPVTKRSQAIKPLTCAFKEKKEPYSKFTVPHFMEDDDEEKFILKAYAGHIPMATTRFGQCNKMLTNSALAEFTNNYHHRMSVEWCPMESAGIGSSCPNSDQFVIYHKNIGVIPKYGGHVPGEAFTFGQTYGNATRNARNWLAIHKD